MLFWAFITICLFYIGRLKLMNSIPKTAYDLWFGSLFRSWLLILSIFFAIVCIIGIFETTSARSWLQGKESTKQLQAEYTLVFWNNLIFYPVPVNMTEVSWYKNE